MKKLRGIIIALLVVIMTFGSVACNRNGREKKEGYTSLRIFINNGDRYDGAEVDRVWEAIEDATKTQLYFEGAPHNSDYYNTLNPMLNTGDLPDIVFSVPGGSSGAYEKWADQKDGILVNIDVLLAERPGEYPWIEKLLGSAQYKNLMYDGAHTIVPYVSDASGWGIYYRKDWLEAVDEEVPVTLEDFERVLKKFTENDPDGNGKNDTWGISPGSGAHFWNPLYHAFGVQPDWGLDEDNNPVYMYETAEFKAFLEWAHGLYEKGYVDPQFNTNINNQDRTKFQDGKTGVLITNAGQHVTWVVTPFEQKQGKDKIVMGAPPVGTATLGKEGAGGFSNWGGWWGGFSITTGCEDPHAALRLLDYLVSQEGSDLRTYGIKGVHYDLDESGNVVPNVEERNKEPQERFMSVTVNDESQPLGVYQLGANFGGALDWSSYDTTGEIKIKIDAKSMDAKYYQLIEDAMRLQTLSTSKLTNVTAYPSTMTTKANKVTDTMLNFVNPAIIGTKNLTTDWTAMLAQCESDGLSDVKNIIRSTIEELGII